MYDVGGVLLPRPFKARRLGHFALWQTDLEMARRLYVDVLGFRSTDTVVRDGKTVAVFTSHGTDHHSLAAIHASTAEGVRKDALRERRVRQSDLLPGRHARGGRQRARVFRAAAGLHQPARSRFSRQQLGALRARSGRAPDRVLLRHGADRMGSPQQAGRRLPAGGAQRLLAAAARRDDGDHAGRAQRRRSRQRISSGGRAALRLLRRRRHAAAAVQGRPRSARSTCSSQISMLRSASTPSCSA